MFSIHENFNANLSLQKKKNAEITHVMPIVR